MAEHGTDPGERTGLEIAVVGMAGRFPGAADVDAFWRNLRDGVESISFLTRQELLAAGADAAFIDLPNFVSAGGSVGGVDELDAGLFHLTPRDAEILNPQHRILLECAWSALEHAGCDPARVGRPVGVFAGCSTNDYADNLYASPGLANAVGSTRISLANDRDHLAAGISYRLDLRGPSIAVQTACSTSLVAVHLACQSLLGGECDLALAGGVAIPVPTWHGYLFAPDGILSPDGHCRAFDADARGTVGGSGAGLVVLKRLEDALAEGDTIHAVIRGSAVNNDGAQKVGYTAPSVTGQARVLSEALSLSGVDPGTVQYVETHGSGTPLGDAIELKAMSQVLSKGGDGHRCAIGSVKPNIGHADAAAGVAGFIKAVLALRHRQIPPSLNCAVPHPEIAAAGGRVFVNTTLTPWERNGTPRRAGVSSFGIGGTNAHVVLEEAPEPRPTGPSRALQLLAVSARTPTALAAAAGNLADFFEAESPPLADAAFTLQTGRREMEHRLAVLCRDAAEGAARLREAAARPSSSVPRTDRPVAFMFPGVGTHHVDMGRGLYDAEPVFRAAVDECCDHLLPLLGSDLRDVLFSPAPAEGVAAEPKAGGGWDLRRLLGRDGGEAREASPLDETRFAQPAVFVVEYALARLWRAWGIRPRALIGHSLGEYVAACVAGVLRLEDALRLVALRAQLIDGLPAGAMLAVPLGEAGLRELLPPSLDVAAVNTPESCVVSGAAADVEAFEAVLAENGSVSRRLSTRHAFHSRAMAGVAAELERIVAGFELRAPEIPVVSNVTGTWMTDDEARSPAYWGRHLCQTVRFADGVATLRAEPGWAFLEVGPGQALGAWALHHPGAGGGDRAVFSSLPHQHNRVDDLRFVLDTLGGLWTGGVEVGWTEFSRGERRGKVPLPGYPFERKRYWVDAPAKVTPASVTQETDARQRDEGAGGMAMGGSEGIENINEGPGVMENLLAPESAPPSRRLDRVLDVLTGIVSHLTGIEQEDVSVEDDFFQAGLDSLLLLQAIQAIEKQVGVRVSLVELLEEITTLGALAAHIDHVLPPDALPAPEPPPTPAPVAMETPAAAPAAAAPSRMIPAPPAFYPALSAGAAPSGDESALERVIAQQLQLMSQQIAAIRGDAAPALAAAPAVAPTAAVAAQACVAPAASATATASAASAPSLVPAAPSTNGTRLAVPQSARAKIQPATFVPYQAVNSDGRGGMTDGEKAYLDSFIARYVERTKASKAHQARYHLPLADSRVTARFRRAWKEILYPIVGQRARGSKIWDLDGNEYVDTAMAFGCSLFGHAPDFVSRAIAEQVERGYGVGPQSPDAGRAAELICELGGNQRAVFCNSGTEAVMGAIRAARAFTGRTRIAYFAGSYHGWSDIVLGRPISAGGRQQVLPIAPGVPPLPFGDVLMLDYDEPESLEILAREMDDIALVMVEPVQSRRPDMKPIAFLRELRRMTQEAGVLLHFDELITGFRLGAGGAQSYFGVQADLVTYGKIVAGGLPMGVVAGTVEAMSVFDGGVWSYGDDSYPTGQRTLFAGAFFKHPLSMGVACAILEEIRSRGPGMYAQLDVCTTALVQRLNAFFEAGGYPVEAANGGSCFRFFFGPEVKFPDLFNHHLILEGVHVIPETGTHFLSTAHDDEDVEKFFRAVCASVEAMRGGGLIPPPPGGVPGSIDRLAPVRVEIASAPSAAAVEVRADGTRVLPLTEGQRQLWFESQMGDAAALAYVESVSARLHGPLDEAALRAALQGVVNRHDTLRATFGPGGDTQVIHPSFPVALPRADFRAVPKEERDARVEAWIGDTVRRPFDLVQGPLVRFTLAALADDEHLLVITTHHAVLDGWSFGVVWGELGVLYAAARDGRAAELPPRRDFAELVRTQVAAVHDDTAAEAFWLEAFADGVPVLELPTDRPRPPVRGYAGERVERVMGGALMHRLAEAGRGHGLTMFNTLLSAYFVWLGRLSGQDDLVVGTPAAGQAGRAGAAELVGYGTNVLPIRARLDAAATFVEHARRVRRTTLRALEHQSFSFPRLVEKLLRTRDPSHPPVFSAMLNLDAEGDAAALGDLRADFDNNFAGGAKVDLHFELVETGDALRLRCVYAAELFDRDTVERWLASFQRLLEQVADDAGVRLSALELMEDGDRRRVLEEWNRTDRVFPRGVCIHHLFDAQVAERPEAEALVWGDVRLTYAQLDARANRLAHHLVRRGVRPESRVGVLLERGVELIVSILAILKAGGCYVPLDPTYPAGRLELMLADAGARVLVTRDGPAAGLAADGVSVVRLDQAAEALAAEPADAPRSGGAPENLAYIVYTSGSTGRPKGVMVGHREVVQLVCETDYVRFAPGDRVAQASNASFDALTFEAWGALLNGATLVGIDRDVLLSPPALRQALRERGITTLYQTTALLNQLAREQPDIFAPLREVLFGGQAADADSVRRILAAGPPRRLLHMYGPTETTAWCAWEEIGQVAEDALTVPVGRPTGNQRIYLLDRALRPAPVGVPGEAYVGGAGIVRGYLDRPSLTAERFVPDPFAAEPGARMYRTGDRMRWRADGRLEFVGRLDDQVKIRGFRIEPGEIESVLSAHPAVREARVVVHQDGRGEPRLAAYVVGEAEAGELRAHLGRTLPDYMVPAAFVTVEALPLTPAGKLDRAALPAPEYAGDDAPPAPGRPAEALLAGIWAEVLGLDRVGARQNFFELGGHSLLAIRVVSRVRAVFGVELPLRTLFEGPTVAALAGAVEALRRDGAQQLPPVVPVGREEAPPLSFAQERLWFLDRLQPGGAFFNIPVPLRLRGALDVPALERALGEVVRRHEALRTTFAAGDGAPVQVIAPFAGFVLAVDDLAGIAADGREPEARRLASEEASRPFDLAAGPLFRARLLRLGGEDHALLLGMHHAVSDGWSLGVFFRELAALYGAFREGAASPLPELAVQYADHAVWQREQFRGEALDRQLAWWKERLAGAPALLELPASHPRPATMTFRGAYEPLELPAELQQRLRALARREGATLYMVVLAAFQALLGSYAAIDDVVVGTTSAGRTRGEVEPLIGLFMNTLVLRTDLSGDPAFREALRRVREVTLGAFEHQDVPFERLVAELRPERSLSHSPVFQVLFELHEAGKGEIGAFPGLEVGGIDTEAGSAKYDLSLALTATPDGLSGGLTYATDLFERGTVRRMVEHLERVLAQAAADPDRRLSRLELMSGAERERVVEWNRTTAKYPADRCIHQLFEAQALKTPDAAALVCGEAALTYRELDARANRLARGLRRLGVGPEVRVGICLERGPELIVSILGVMKAGGAWVPLDHSHPAERQAYVLDDSGVAVLLTQEKLRAAIPAPAGVRVLSVDAPHWFAAEPAEAPESGVTAGNLCYVIYTSGSTGRPKGVAMHHRGVCNYIHWGVRAYGADRGSGAPVFTSMAVDLTISNLLPLFAGRPVRLLPEENPVQALAAAIRERPGFGLLKITPIHLGLLNSLLAPEELAAAAHTLVIGADFLTAEPTVAWQEHAPGVRLMNEYGPTETVVGCSAYVLPPGRHRAGPVPVGHPIQNLSFYVLDAHLEPVPVGLPGELFIGGAGVARGYLGRPALTAEKFLPDPFTGTGERMYRTGDRARWQADGNLMILGRTDNQVKVRGYRVELGEIEAVLRRHEAVRECLVVMREERPDDRRLVAYVVGDADAATLRAHLGATLPEYMVPAAFVRLDELPRTATGKLDPKTLPAPVYAEADPAADAEPGEPRNYVEAQLIQLWEEQLGATGIGPTQSFFELGGNSLLALRLFARANRRLGCDLPLATLFAGATVRQMADAVLEQRRAAPEAPAVVVPLQPHGSHPPVFFVHSADREVMGYVNLVRHLGPDQPAFGVRDLGDLARPVAEIAAGHVAAIREVQPSGPYHLVSWSFGGIVAFEMALQLEAAGETVALVGLMDTVSPVLMEEWGWDRDADVVVALAHDAAAEARRPFRLRPEELDDAELDEQVRRAVEALYAQGAAPPDYDVAALREAVGTVHDRNRGTAGYVPGLFSGTVTLFRAGETSERFDEFFATRGDEETRTLGWAPYAALVEVHTVPGPHATLGSEPHVRVLAAHLRDALADARERAAHLAAEGVPA